MIAFDQVVGLVLCQVGDHRLAFSAHQINAVEPWAVGDPPRPDARGIFQLPLRNGRILVSEAGESVVVDGLEIYQDALPLLPPPPLVVGGAGGALRGFVSVKDQLWPVFRLDEFSRFLEAATSEGPA